MKWHKYPTEGNRLSKLNPELCKEWDYTKNDISPDDYASGSGKKAWWVCHICGHSWQSQIRSRNKGAGCPKCTKGLHVSKLELRIYSELKYHFPDAAQGTKIDGVEADVFIPALKTIIEVDGWKWHQDVIRDTKKNSHFHKRGFKVVRVRLGLPAIGDKDIVCDRRAKERDVVKKVLLSFGICQEGFVNDEHYKTLLYDFRHINPESSLEDTHPHLVSQWNKRNKPLLPIHVSKGCTDKVWWICEYGHEWEARIDSRVEGNGCPKCAGRTNRMVSDTPLAKEWSDKNIEASKDVPSSCKKKYWWWCKKHNYHYKKSPHSRYYVGVKCPFCSGIRPQVEHSLLSCPAVASRWDYVRNGVLKPEDLRMGSGKKIWLKRKDGTSALFIAREIVNRKSEI